MHNLEVRYLLLAVFPCNFGNRFVYKSSDINTDARSDNTVFTEKKNDASPPLTANNTVYSTRADYKFKWKRD